MEYSVNKAFNASAEIADSIHCELDTVYLLSTLTNRAMGMVAHQRVHHAPCADPDLRFVTFEPHSAKSALTHEPWMYPLSKAKYMWGVSKPENFEPESGKIQSYPSAVCYFFGRDLYKRLGGKVPIGLVAATQGGTKVELFMSPEAIADRTCGGTVSASSGKPEVGPGSGLWFGMILPLTPLKISG